MKIMDFLSPEAVVLDIKATDAESAIREMVEVLKRLKKIKDTSELIDILLQREKLGSTGIGQGVAIPHGKIDLLEKQVGVLGISRSGVDFKSLDGAPAHLIFLLVSPSNTSGEHLLAMASISRVFKDRLFRQSLLKATTAQEVIGLIKELDQE
jgi:nitrogen PTS system EIIA component